MIDFLLDIGLKKMKKYMKKHQISDLSAYPDGILAMEQAVFFLSKKIRKMLVEGVALFSAVM